MKHGTALFLIVFVVLIAAFGIAAVIPAASTVWAQGSPSPVPARDGSPDFGPVREKIVALMKDSGVPSVSVALARKGKIVWTE